MITKYKVVIGDPAGADFTPRINQLISEGWQPHGSPTFVVMGNPNYTKYVVGYQAMIYV